MSVIWGDRGGVVKGDILRLLVTDVPCTSVVSNDGEDDIDGSLVPVVALVVVAVVMVVAVYVGTMGTTGSPPPSFCCRIVTVGDSWSLSPMEWECNEDWSNSSPSSVGYRSVDTVMTGGRGGNPEDIPPAAAATPPLPLPLKPPIGA